MDLPPAQQRVKPVVQDRREDYDAEWVEVRDQVVRHSICLEHGGEETGGAAEAVVVDVLDREEAEDPGRLKGASHVLNELVVPLRVNVMSFRGNHGRFRGIPEAVAADAEDAPTRETDLQHAHDVGEVAASRGKEDEALAQPDLQRERPLEVGSPSKETGNIPEEGVEGCRGTEAE